MEVTTFTYGFGSNITITVNISPIRDCTVRITIVFLRGHQPKTQTRVLPLPQQSIEKISYTRRRSKYRLAASSARVTVGLISFPIRQPEVGFYDWCGGRNELCCHSGVCKCNYGIRVQQFYSATMNRSVQLSHY